uniref:PH domain-containing protein n=1 Tax=Anopheles epiroticus TaxID=199890 RepID=A0A182PM21_9DIPT
MDPFTQNILERAEKRAAALGITNTSKFPLSEFNYEADKQGGGTGASPKKKTAVKKHSAPKPPPPPATTTVSTRTATDGERTTTLDIGGQDNCDLALEINITTSANLQVDLGVKELENDGSVKKQWEHNIVRALEGEKENSAESKSVIRDESRNQLQRLGTLYSDTQDLSSPVHRTEGRFHEDMKQSSKPKPKLAKLAMLADTINNWEDDTSHPDITHHRETIVPGRERKSPISSTRQQSPKRVGVASASTTGTGATPKKYPAPNPPKSILCPNKPGSTGGTAGESFGATGKAPQTKSLKWDQKVMDTLESQGFQRRESTTSKLVYDYKEDKNGKKTENYRAPVTVSSVSSTSRERNTTQADQAEEVKKSAVTSSTSTTQQKKVGVAGAPKPAGGLVSGRAALFEKSSGRRQSILKPGQKDPAEMSLKERMAIFEKNKGAALVPKAAFGISPSIRQITGQKESGKASSSGSGPMSCAAIQGSGFGSITQHAANKTAVAPASPQSKPKVVDHAKSASKVETKATGSAIRNTVEALMSDTSTISQSEISEEIRRLRQQEMEMLLNRFTKPADMSPDTIEYEPQPIPSAPPMPPEGYLTGSAKKNAKQSMDNVHGGLPAKRRSDGTNDSADVMAALDDVKRIRVGSTAKDGRMYPALSDIETTATESGDDGAIGDDYTTATVSGSEGSECAYRTCYGDTVEEEHEQRNEEEEDEEEYDEEEENERHQYEVDEDDDSFMYSDDDEEANIANVSLGREILQAVKLNDRRTSRGRGRQSQEWKQSEEQVAQVQATKGVSFSLDRTAASDGSDLLEDSDMIDACLEEALVDEEEDSEAFDTPRKSSVSSNSFSYQKHSGRDRCVTINEEESEKTPKSGSSKRKSGTPRKSQSGPIDYSSPVRSELQVKPSKDDDDMVTLVHTVSFYRRQQQQQQSSMTPRKVPRTPVATTSPNRRGVTVDSTTADDSDEEEGVSSTAESTSTGTEEGEFLVQEKVKKLLDEVCKQQTIIAQASQALNLCAATIEFSGSTESAEGERHLLVATHRRQAILDEVQRLRVEGCLRPPGAPTEKGRLTVKDITLPLKQEYMRKLASDQISGHNLVCLLKYNETVLATQTAPTLPGLLSVRFPDVLQLSNVFADFKITMEIYGMPASREVLPHEIKYHIALGGKKKTGSGTSKLLHTPKGLKSNSRLIMPPVQSPAGPQAVRSPSLTLYGFIIFSLKEIQRTSWTLNPISGCASPLDGTVNMRVNCELAVTVDYHGFLTMYEDVSGLGAWHRRWCRLQRHTINYWKYPDDEKRKAPIGSIDLQGCSTQRVGVAPRDICSRLNTLMLEFPRPARDDDVESLKVVRQGKTTIERYLLSADSKEERDEWCAHLNKTLALLKAWGASNVPSS